MAALSIAPKHKMYVTYSFFHVDQLRGSLGSSDGWGASTICAFLPVPCLSPPVTASE